MHCSPDRPTVQRLALLILMLLSLSAQSQPRIAIIIDDLGYHRSHGEATVALPGAITCAIIPHTPHAGHLARLAERAGKEVIIHMPMQAHGQVALEQHGLIASMNREQIQQHLEQAIASLPQARGLNNHMGSLLTEQQAPMDWLMSSLREHQLFFVDSRTSPRSLAQQRARQHGIKHGRRDIFLDNQRDLASINRQFNRLISRARQQGQAIAIGHPYPETLSYLGQVLPLLDDAGIELVPVSTLLDRELQSAQR